jgi:hypothetical protein
MNGLAEPVKVVAFADSLGTVEVLDFERSAPDGTTCQMVGAKFAYSVSLDTDATVCSG